MCHVVELAQRRLDHVLRRRAFELLHHEVVPLVVSVEGWVLCNATAAVARLKHILCFFLKFVAEETRVTDIS